MNKTATAPSDPVVQLQQAGKDYKKGREHITVLHDLDFSLRGGEMVSIMGPSGSGKSTLLNLISGVNVCDRGEVFLQGYPLHRLRPEERTSLRARHIGFVFQFYNLLPVLSAEENVALPLHLWHMDAKQRRQRVDAALALVQMEHRRRHLPDELSGGERQRVAIARAIATNPDLLLCDEPTGDLSQEAGEEIMDIMTLLSQEQGKAIIVVTHDIQVAARAQRQFQLRDGKLIHRDMP
ncbi:ABC transporter ATP-binding protein [Serratia nevei]|uniref:ABC transporter ATP-binding protein n=1 Tax=Serratia nevei TaxID=2703794 RepID=UPI00209CC002|nr:ABC transporter ATP-binding protein [Serratia nevei]MCP1106735.1 ABC transporter ATP-binding protein [Serratia nevei]